MERIPYIVIIIAIYKLHMFSISAAKQYER